MISLHFWYSLISFYLSDYAIILLDTAIDYASSLETLAQSMWLRICLFCVKIRISNTFMFPVRMIWVLPVLQNDLRLVSSFPPPKIMLHTRRPMMKFLLKLRLLGLLSKYNLMSPECNNKQNFSYLPIFCPNLENFCRKCVKSLLSQVKTLSSIQDWPTVGCNRRKFWFVTRFWFQFKS